MNKMENIMMQNIKKKQIRFIAIIIMLNLPIANIFSAGAKNVLILDFVNIEKNKNFDYLGGSLTEAIRNKLKELFVFKETPRSEWKEVAEKNFLYKDEFNTKSVAMNLGLLSRQDVVISGDFKVIIKPQVTNVLTTVRIYDIQKKVLVTEIKEELPYDSRIFDGVDRISARIAEEARAVLPTKEEWKRTGASEPSGPFFNNYMLFASLGGGLYAMDYANDITANLPAVHLGLRVNTPGLTQSMTLSLSAFYINDEPVIDNHSALEGLNITTRNYILGGYMGWEFLMGKFSMHPRFGGGYVIQVIEVTGIRNENLSNSLPFAAAGLDFGYKITQRLDMILSAEGIFEFESGNTTLLSLGMLGVQYRL